MKIEFKTLNEARISTLIKAFEINSDSTVRIMQFSDQIVIKLRNAKFETLGRIFKIEQIETINKIEFAGEIYDNLQYCSHEIYIHHPEDVDFKMVLCEDLNITFKKVK